MICKVEVLTLDKEQMEFNHEKEVENIRKTLNKEFQTQLKLQEKKESANKDESVVGVAIHIFVCLALLSSLNLI